MMMTVTRFACLALLVGALSTPTLAQEDGTRTFVVRGSNVAGTAQVTDVGSGAREGTTRVTVTVSVERFGKHADTFELSGEGIRRADGRVEWSHSTEVSQPRSGLVDWIRDPYLVTPEPRTYSVDVKSIMRPKADGDLEGVVAGMRQTWTRTPDSEGLIVLMIPGLSTNYWNRMGLPYFDENRDAMRAQGLEVRRLGTKPDGSIDPDAAFATENSVEENAAVIADEIRAEAERGKRVILFAHSKGGTDATAALALYPDLIPHVAGMVAIQPVYGGSPVANFAGSTSLTAAGVALAFEVWAGGNRDAVLDITTEARAAFVAKHPYPADRIPTVVVRSTFSRSLVMIGRDANNDGVSNVGKRFFQRALRTNQWFIQAHEGKASDGMVDLEAQTIPGAKLIDKENLDHFEPGLTMISPHTPSNLTTEAMDALFEMLTK